MEEEEIYENIVFLIVMVKKRKLEFSDVAFFIQENSISDLPTRSIAITLLKPIELYKNPEKCLLVFILNVKCNTSN